MNARWSAPLHKFSSLLIVSLLLTNGLMPAQAAVLFQDDTFGDVESDFVRIGSNDAGAVNTGIQFGADVTASENGNITWDITTNTFLIDHTTAITGGISATGNANFAGSSEFHMRQVADEAAADCTTVDELVLDTTENRIYVCTATGTPGTWTASDSGSADTLDSVYTNDGDKELTINNAAGLVFDITGAGGSLAVQDAGTNVFEVTNAGGVFFDPTSGQNFDVTTTGAGDIVLNSGDTVDVDSTNAITIDSSAAGVSIDATTSSNVTVGANSAGNQTLTISATNAGAGEGNVAISGEDNVTISSTTGDTTITGGDDLFFDDAQLTSPVQLTETATAINAAYGTNGIIDALNALSSTATGDGASIIGVEDTANYFTGTNVETVLQEIGAQVGANADNVEVLTFYPEYPDSVIFRDGTANTGTLVSEYDDTNDEHFYRWTTNNGALQDIEVRYRFPLPADFADVNDFTYRFRTDSTTAGDNNLHFTVFNATDETLGAPTLCGTDTTNTSAVAGVWETGTITEATLEAGCTGGTALSAGDIVEVMVKFFDNSGAADAAYAGFLSLGYDN